MPQVQEVLRAQLRKLIPGELPWPLYVWSKQPGTGKTSAALAMLDHCGPIVDPTWFSSDHARDAFAGFLDLTTLPRLVEQLARGMIKRADADSSGMTVTESQFWNQISRAKLIVIDDIRVPGQKEIKLGEDHYSVLKRILDERVQRPLIVTSNIAPWGEPSELVHAFDDRIADRMASGSVVELAGESRRWE